jgi:hypothetical protein
MRGYFAIGVEGITKAMTMGSLFRSAILRFMATSAPRA